MVIPDAKSLAHAITQASTPTAAARASAADDIFLPRMPPAVARPRRRFLASTPSAPLAGFGCAPTRFDH
jgi:hypothetical protein